MSEKNPDKGQTFGMAPSDNELMEEVRDGTETRHAFGIRSNPLTSSGGE